MKKFLVITFLLIISGIKDGKGQNLSRNYATSVAINTSVQNKNYKNPGVALSLSLGGTILPLTAGFMFLPKTLNERFTVLSGIDGLMILYGFIGGASTGLFYDQRYHKAYGGLVVRTLSSGGILAGAVWTFGNSYGVHGKDITIPVFFTITSSVVLLSSIIFQIIQAPRLAKKFDDENNLSIAPTYFGHEKSLGLAMTIRF